MDDLYQDPYAINTTSKQQFQQPAQPAAVPDEAARKIFIGGLNWDTTEDSLKEYFSRFGDVVQLNIMRDPNTNKSRGFGFLTFADIDSVQQVMIRDHWLDGKLIDPKRNMHRHDNLKHKKIFVGGIPLQMPVEQVVEEFRAVFGNITDANLMYDKESGRSRGFGFLTFETEQQAESAVSEGRFDLHGKSVEVKRVQTRNERSGTQDAGKQYQTSMFGGPTNNPFNPQAMAAMYQRMGWNAFGGVSSSA